MLAIPFASKLSTSAEKFVGAAGRVWADAGRANAPVSASSAAAACARAEPTSERRATRGRAKPAGRPAADAAYVQGEEPPPRRGGRRSGGDGGRCCSRSRGAVMVSARLGSARLGSARLGSARLGSARLGSARLGSARLGSARLGSARLGSARLGSAHNSRLNTLAGCQVFCRVVHPCSPSASLRPGNRAGKATGPIVLTVVVCRLQPCPTPPPSRASSRCRTTRTAECPSETSNVPRQTHPRYLAAYARRTGSETSKNLPYGHI